MARAGEAGFLSISAGKASLIIICKYVSLCSRACPFNVVRLWFFPGTRPAKFVAMLTIAYICRVSANTSHHVARLSQLCMPQILRQMLRIIMSVLRHCMTGEKNNPHIPRPTRYVHLYNTVFLRQQRNIRATLLFGAKVTRAEWANYVPFCGISKWEHSVGVLLEHVSMSW